MHHAVFFNFSIIQLWLLQVSVSRVPELQEKFNIIRDVNTYLGEINNSNGFIMCDPGRVLCKEVKKRTSKLRIQPQNWREAGPDFTDKNVGYHPSAEGMKKFVQYLRNFVKFQIFE